MTKGVIALYTTDDRYANAFLDYNLRREKEKMMVKIFTNEESFFGAVDRESFDLLLVDGMCMDEKIIELPCKMAVLSRKKFIAKQDYPAVFMYQKAILVFRQIYDILSEETVEERYCCAAISAMPKIYGVYSPCYPLLREKFARSIAGYIGRQYKVLFMNMASFTENDTGEEKGLSELFYFIQQEDRSMVYKLNAMVKREKGFDSLPGVHHYNDISDIRPEDVMRLMKQFEMVDEYDVVVVDIGLDMESAYCLLEYCSNIWMPIDKNVGYKRQIHMKEDVKREKGNDVWERIEEIDMPYEWYEREENMHVWMKEHIDISRLKSS